MDGKTDLFQASNKVKAPFDKRIHPEPAEGGQATRKRVLGKAA
jgi:hypothetical protein